MIVSTRRLRKLCDFQIQGRLSSSVKYPAVKLLPIMKSVTLAIILLLQLHSEVATDDGFCSADTKSDCEIEKGAYSQFSNEILGKIAAAEAGYQECTEGGCKCYEAVIDSDLAKFPTVTREMLTEIRDKIFLPVSPSSIWHRQN